jgi:hypothetical protein
MMKIANSIILLVMLTCQLSKKLLTLPIGINHYKILKLNTKIIAPRQMIE